MLSISGIKKTFNWGTANEKTALHGLDLHLRKGDYVTIIGGNGSGKSTLLNCICGTYEVDCGSIVVDGQDVTAYPEHKRAKFLGRVFQDPMLGTSANMSIAENLALANRRGIRRGLKKGIKGREEREFFQRSLSKLGLGLEERMGTRVGLLSGGQRQALTLLMAALKQPKLLLLDEHTAALDPATAVKVLELTNSLIKDNGLTALMVTHNMHDAIRYGDRLIMMHDGVIALDIAGEEKRGLTVEYLLQRFSQVSRNEFSYDRALLA